MQAFAEKLVIWPQAVCVYTCPPLAAPAENRKASAWFPVQHSLPEMEQRSRERSADHLHHHILASITCQLLPIYLVVNAFAVESYVNSECGGIVVRDEQGLLVRFVPHHKVQGSGTLMREDMLVSREQEPMRELQLVVAVTFNKSTHYLTHSSANL